MDRTTHVRERSGALLLLTVTAIVVAIVAVVAVAHLLHTSAHPCPLIQGVRQACRR
jgi:hypothetical protein